jgi:glycosyltransferase involved in cell wall biosynthesis
LKLAYVLDRFPVLSETFIAREIEGLAREGVRPELFALRRGEEAAEETAEGAGGRTPAAEILPGAFSPRVFSARLAWFIKSPLRTLDAAATLVAGTSRSPRTLPAEILHAVRGSHLARELVRRGVTHVHAHFGFVPSTVAWLASKLTGIPYSVSVHAWDVFVNRSMLPEKLTQARRVVTCTEYARAWILARWPVLDPRRVVCVHHGLDLEEHAPRPLPEDSTFSVLAVGRLVPKKGFVHLVGAFARARDALGDTPCRLTIVGGGPERAKIERLAREIDLAGSFRMTGALRPAEVRGEIARSQVLVAPSVMGPRGDRDGLPNVVLEAAAAGRPVIGSRFTGIPEAVSDAETGFLVPPGDESAMAERITRLARDRGLARRMGAAGRALVERDFSLRKSSRALAAVLREAAGRVAGES